MTDKELKQLFEGVKSDLLTVDVQKKIKTLIEATVAVEAKTEKEKLGKLFEKAKAEEAARIEKRAVKHLDETIVNRLNSWLDVVANEYVNENKLAIENGLAKQLHESMVKGMQELLAEHSIPTAEKSKVDQLVEQIKGLKDQQKELLEKSVAYKQEANGAKAVAIFESLTGDLSDLQKDKLKKLSGSLETDDLKEFKEKLLTLKEAVVSKKEVSAKPITEKAPARKPASEENEGADSVSPIKFREEGSPNGAFANIPDMSDLL